jgi:hypothetical protein
MYKGNCFCVGDSSISEKICFKIKAAPALRRAAFNLNLITIKLVDHQFMHYISITVPIWVT